MGNKSKAEDACYNPMAIRWSERYHKQLEAVWSSIPQILRSSIVTVCIVILGASLRGEWILMGVHTLKLLTKDLYLESFSKRREFSLNSFKLEHLNYFIFCASLVSYVMYFSIGGFLHWYWYVRQRDRAADWKCQPTKFMSPDLERHEILLGSFSLLITSSFSGLLACYIYNEGWSTIYYSISDYPVWWWLLQWPAIFLYQDYLTYWLHRIYHTPFLYKHFHKLHHKYKQPTAFSVTAIHPVEIMHIQISLLLPIFIVPIHPIPFYGIALYTYYHGIIDHSGINFKSFWWQPWQPDAIFHDNHHQYFHVNFGFNCFFWDKIHGTHRRKDRFYTEDIFYGRGKSLDQATKEELLQDMNERISENPKAYRGNKHEFLETS